MQVIHNLLTDEELKAVQVTLKQQRWGFGFISTDRNKPIWNFDKESGRSVAELVASKLSGYNLDDWHINGQTFMLDGSPHQDSYANCDTAAVFFPHDWEYVWGGRLHVFTEHGAQIITPQKNMAVIFDSSLFHYAEAPSVPVLRVSVGLKLKSREGADWK